MLRDRIARGQRVLHIAPEPFVIPWLVSLSSEYLTIDLYKPAMRKMDLTNLELADNSKTLIWCSHVLEHILEDRKALSEIYRVLEPGGLLVLQVPIGGDVTFEDGRILDEHERILKFLQNDHVRLYGLDLKDRVECAGFECEILTASQLSRDERIQHAVDAKYYREIFLCRRPKASPLA